MGHDHHTDQTYYLEQVCTVALAGALAGVAIMMYTTGNLFFLDNTFKGPVLWAGGVLVIMVLIRAVTLWIQVGKPAAASAHAAVQEMEEDCCGAAHDVAHEHDCGHDHGHGASCGHDHGHGHSHGHSHAHGHSHGDDHGHSHTWNPWRFAILLFPVVLFFMNLPNPSFAEGFKNHIAGRSLDFSNLGQASPTNYASDVGVRLTEGKDGLPQVLQVEPNSPAAREGIQATDAIVSVAQVVDKKDPEPESTKGMTVSQVLDLLQGKDGSKVKLGLRRVGAEKPIDVVVTRNAKVMLVTFKEIEPAAYSQRTRDFYGGRKIKVIGQYIPGSSSRSFRLARFKVTCCMADMQMLGMSIETPEPITDIQSQDWIAVEGQVQFRERADRKGEYVTVLKVGSRQQIQPATQQNDL